MEERRIELVLFTKSRDYLHSHDCYILSILSQIFISEHKIALSM